MDELVVLREFESAPEIAVQDVSACPVCRSTEWDEFASGYDYELQTCSNLWKFVQCRLCHHVWLNPRPAVDELSVIYPPSYYAYNYDRTVPAVARWAKRQLDRRKMSGIMTGLTRPPSSYLDVGCGDGRYLDAMHRRGLDKSQIYGLELTESVVSELRDRGYRVFCERVEDCTEIEDKSLDLITMFHVIEHVDDPNAVIRRLSNWLKPGGVLAMETPNIESVDARWWKRTFWGGYHIPRHWNLFLKDTLQKLCEANGLKVESTTYQTGHSFWMYSMHHALRYGQKPRPWLAKWFDPFSNLPMLAVITAFDKTRAIFGCKTSAMLMTATKAE